MFLCFQMMSQKRYMTEYYEKFEGHLDNKKHKRLKKSTAGMDFDSYSGRLSEFSKEYI